MKTRKWCLSISLVILLVLSFVTPVSADVKHVYGTNIHPADYQNVQAALDAVQPGGKVVLHGLFDFGAWDWGTGTNVGAITMSKPGVTLAGQDNAKIVGGGKYLDGPDPYYFIFVIHIEAPGVQVQNVELEGSPDTGILVWVLSSATGDKPITIKDCKISAFWADVFCTGTACPLVLKGNTLMVPYGLLGLYAFQKQGTLEVIGNRVEGAPETYGLFATESLGPVSMKDNVLDIEPSAWSQGIHTCWGSDVVSIKGNTVRGAGIGIITHDNGQVPDKGAVEMVDNDVEASRVVSTADWYDQLQSTWDMCPVTIRGNRLKSILDDAEAMRPAINAGIWVLSWIPIEYGGGGPSNPPVIIQGNIIDTRYPFPGTPAEQNFGIWLGGVYTGTDNVRVIGNKISGAATAGIVRGPYGQNSLIRGNNLSGLKTWQAQVVVWSEETTVSGNTMGFSNGIPGYSTALELASNNQAAQMWGDGPPMPNPVQNCVVSGNDYRKTSLPGWPGGGSGCVHVFSYGDKGGYGTEVKYNLIAETGMFPPGTSMQDQILIENSALVHDNSVVGMNGYTLAATTTSEGIAEDAVLAKVGSVPWAARASVAACPGRDSKNVNKLNKMGARPLPGKESGTISIPATIALEQNYPNPFNPSTTIRYALPVRSHVTLTLYNSLGQVITTLAQGEQEAGYHDVVFEASGLSSGVYFYRLTAGVFTDTKRLVLMR